jgi:SAM-dependent methyltransferase
MRDAEFLRRVYNERFSGPASSWTSEDPATCRRIARRTIRWTNLKDSKWSRMLDVGCALGYFTKAFYLEGFEAYGLDYSDVAISRATELHPECSFIHTDGFNPALEMRFDLIFCKGFSGANTHDLNFVAEWSNKYINLLNPSGKFVFSFSTNFTGEESDNETVNWTKKEIYVYINLIEARCSGIKYYHKNYLISQLASKIFGFLTGKKVKRYFYIIFTKS